MTAIFIRTVLKIKSFKEYVHCEQVSLLSIVKTLYRGTRCEVDHMYICQFLFVFTSGITSWSLAGTCKNLFYEPWTILLKLYTCYTLWPIQSLIGHWIYNFATQYNSKIMNYSNCNLRQLAPLLRGIYCNTFLHCVQDKSNFTIKIIKLHFGLYTNSHIIRIVDCSFCGTLNHWVINVVSSMYCLFLFCV